MKKFLLSILTVIMLVTVSFAQTNPWDGHQVILGIQELTGL